MRELIKKLSGAEIAALSGEVLRRLELVNGGAADSEPDWDERALLRAGDSFAAEKSDGGEAPGGLFSVRDGNWISKPGEAAVRDRHVKAVAEVFDAGTSGGVRDGGGLYGMDLRAVEPELRGSEAARAIYESGGSVEGNAERVMATEAVPASMALPAGIGSPGSESAAMMFGSPMGETGRRGLNLSEVSEHFKRDARRFDNGYELY